MNNNNSIKKILKSLESEKENKDYLFLVEWIKKHSKKQELIGIINYLKEYDFGKSYFDILNWIRKKEKLEYNSDFNVTSKYFNKFIKPNFSSKNPSYNLISEFINLPVIELYKNQKINVYGFFQEANKFVSTIKDNYINKIVIDYDFSTFTVSIPSIKGTYDQKISIFDDLLPLNQDDILKAIKKSMSCCQKQLFNYSINIFVFDLDNKFTKETISYLFSKPIKNSINICVLLKKNKTFKISKEILQTLQKSNLSFILSKESLDICENITNCRSYYKQIGRFIEDLCEFKEDLYFFLKVYKKPIFLEKAEMNIGVFEKNIIDLK